MKVHLGFDTTWILLDRPVWNVRAVQFETFGPSSLTLLNRPFYAWSYLIHDRPLWLKRLSTIVLDRPLWLKWPSSLAQDRSLLDRPSTFARPSTGPDSSESRFIFLYLSTRTKLDDRKDWKWLICEIEQFKRQKMEGSRRIFRVLLKVLPTAKFP